MIPAFDLRIGNLITVSGVVYRITGISETKVNSKGHKGSFSLQDLHPIPLTAEILEKAGFKELKKTNWFDKIPAEGFSYKLHAHRIMIFHAGENTLSHSLNSKIVFLHQLQNLYYHLTGREIVIDL